MRVIIAGGREFNDRDLMWSKLDKLFSYKRKKGEKIIIVSGNARGADRLGETYASSRGMKVLIYKADWKRYPKSAGYRRNEDMADNADALVAFWDGESKGTKHMIETAQEKGLDVRVVRWTPRQTPQEQINNNKDRLHGQNWKEDKMQEQENPNVNALAAHLLEKAKGRKQEKQMVIPVTSYVDKTTGLTFKRYVFKIRGFDNHPWTYVIHEQKIEMINGKPVKKWYEAKMTQEELLHGISHQSNYRKRFKPLDS